MLLKSDYKGYIPLRSDSPLRTNMSDMLHHVQQTNVSRLARRTWIPSVVGLLICTTIFFSQRQQASNFPIHRHNGPHAASVDSVSPPVVLNSTEGSGWDVCQFDTTILESYQLTPSIQYSRRVIRSRSAPDAERESLALINDKLIPDFDAVSVEVGRKTLSGCVGVLDLVVPVSAPLADASAFIFGIASDIDRLGDSFDQLKHWLPYTRAKLLAIVPPHSGTDALQKRYRDAGMDVTFQQSADIFAIRYFSLVRQLHRMRTPEAKWVVLIDDDTFFLSLANVISHFEKRYDHNTPFYIGAVSEDIEQIKRHGYMAYGGGGVFLSMPLVDQVVMAHDQCLQTDKTEGDQIVNLCILSHSSVRLQVDYNLHQMDFKGNPAGFFESGRMPLSIHHWKSWYTAPVPKMARIARACGNECMLQRFRFADNMVLSNGYSIVEYKEINLIDFDLIENTMLESDQRYEHCLGPFRPELRENIDKITFLMEDTIVGPDHVRQVYIHRDPKKVQDEVIELIWIS